MLAQSDVANPVNWAQTGIIGGLVLLIIWTGVKRVWLFKWTHDEIIQGKDRELKLKDDQLAIRTAEAAEWKTIARQGAGVLEKTVDRAAVLVEKAVPDVVTIDQRLGRINEELQAIRHGGE